MGEENIGDWTYDGVDCGGKMNAIQHSGGHHGFDVLDDDETNRQIIKQTLLFIEEQLGKY